RLPLFVRISVTDWEAGGWDLEQSIELAHQLKPLGVDLMDCSSGGNLAQAKIPVGPGYQTPFAERIRREARITTGAIGLITSPVQADRIIRTGQADVVLLAREFLRDPYWPLRYEGASGHFAPVRVNDTLTFDFDNADNFDIHHYAFHVSDEEFDAIWKRVQEAGLSFGSDPWNLENRKLNSWNGGRGVYFRDPSGHILELMTRT